VKKERGNDVQKAFEREKDGKAFLPHQNIQASSLLEKKGEEERRRLM